MHKKGYKAVQNDHTIPPPILDDESTLQLLRLVVANDLERLRACLDSLTTAININSVVHPNPKYKKGSLLLAACQKVHLEMVKVLVLNYSCNFNQGTSNGTTPLYIACHNNHSQIVQFLLDHVADLNRARVDDGFMPLHVAAGKGYFEVVETLLGHEANEELNLVAVDVNQAASDGQTAVYLACQENHLNVAELLLQHGADVNKATNKGITPLMIAAYKGHYDMTRLLRSDGADPAMVDDDNNKTAVQYAQAGNHPDIAQWLTATSSYSTLYAAIDSRCQGAILKALKDGADVYDSNNEYNKVALAVARTASLSGRPVVSRIVRLIRLSMQPWSYERRFLLRAVFPRKWYACGTLFLSIYASYVDQVQLPGRMAAYSESERAAIQAGAKLSPDLWCHILGFAGRNHFSLEF